MAQLIRFSVEAQGDIRAIDRATAIQILQAIARLVAEGLGDVSRLHGFDPPRFRLRVGAWRVVFRHIGEGAIQIIRVGHRSDIYR